MSLTFYIYATIGAYDHYVHGFKNPKLDLQEIQRLKAKNAAKYGAEYG